MSREQLKEKLIEKFGSYLEPHIMATIAIQAIDEYVNEPEKYVSPYKKAIRVEMCQHTGHDSQDIPLGNRGWLIGFHCTAEQPFVVWDDYSTGHNGEMAVKNNDGDRLDTESLLAHTEYNMSGWFVEEDSIREVKESE